MDADSPLFSGVITALVTPFGLDSEVDFVSLEKILERQVDGGVHGIVVCGSTGEAASLSSLEFESVVSYCINFAKKNGARFKVIVGLSSNNLEKCKARSKLAGELGADGLMLVTPYYSRPTQEGMFLFCNEVANSTNLPILLYNVPSRTGADLHPKTVAKLATIQNIVGLKDAKGDLSRVYECKYWLRSGGVDAGKFGITCGDDKIFVEFCALGGCGVVSVVSNMFPSLLVEIYNLCKAGKYYEAELKQSKMYTLIDALFSVPNPIGVKFGLYTLGLCENVLRLPLMPMEEPFATNLSDAISRLQESISI